MKPQILIVDDKTENLMALERVLAGLDVRFIRAESGNEALALTLETEFALALVDIQMPEMDGFETVELMRMQKKTKYLPVIFVSAIYSERSHQIKGLETGAVDFIVKPIVPEILIGKVKILLELYEQKQALEKIVLDRQQRAQAFRLLAEGLIAGVKDSDIDIFNRIVSTCTTLFQTQSAIVGKLTDEGKIESCAAIIDGKVTETISYYLTKSPCQKVVTSGTFLLPEGKISSRYPESRFFSNLDTTGYIGICLKDSHGQPIGVLNVFCRKTFSLPDFTAEALEIISTKAAALIERQKADEVKGLLQERLQQAQKMEAIGTLAGGIAHDFNNILTPIMGFAEMARDSVEKNNPLHKDLSQVIKASVRAKELVQQILTFSRQSSQEIQALAIQPVIREALKLLRATIPTTITITEDIEPETGMIRADPTQIHQVMMNLCTNAYHSMREKGGTLSVSLKKTDPLSVSDTITREAEKKQVYIRLKITDTGTGMDNKTLNKIFEPYFTTKSRGEGTGLGLSAVHGILDRCDAKITVSSTLGIGTVFRIYFPLLSQADVMDSDQPAPAIPSGREHILLVDDEQQICRMMSMMLNRLGYKVTSFQNPEKALMAYKDNPKDFDLTVTDMTMPEMTGTALSKHILEIRPDARIILCTGFSDLTDHTQARSMGIRGYLMKPVSKKDLATTIRDVLDEQ